jgi:condensin complex subunit 2
LSLTGKFHLFYYKANINLNKLDSAFDIDPLFHKMSKTFDEGGAKGLLLVNLGIGGNGCNIVFDSSNDQQMNTESMEDKDILNPEANDEDKPPRIEDGEIDISSQIQKIESTLSTGFADNSIESIPLVPQLSGLRAEYALLEQQGFVSPDEQIAATVGPKTPGRRRYHADEDEERLADQSIHKEAMERSRLSAGNNISALRFDDESSPVSGGNNDDDFAGDYYDDDDGDAFDNFIVSSDHANRYSDFSLEDKMSFAKNGSGDDTKNLLDAISSGKTVLAESDYSYFDTFTSNNYWAGAAHWNRAITKKPLVGKNAPSSTRKPPSKRSTKCTASINKGFRGVDLVTEPDLSFLVENTKRKSASSIQLSRAMITKHTHSDNLLPEDAGFKVDHLVQLFLRPSSKIIIRDATGNSVIALESSVSENAGGGKTVGFNLPEWDAASFGDHGDDGPGYDFGGGYDEDYNDDDDEVLLPELEGVRKVEKVRVGFATVAKNVDVKRLKRDLWMELEQRFQLHASPCAEEDENDSMDAETPRQSLSPFSFQVAVNELEAQKSQVDATLPFYFICILHLANEKGLRLESQGLDDFIIHLDNTVQLQSY